nr:arsenate reductase ArsC [Candidatus Sigynarchaeota archaeon]
MVTKKLSILFVCVGNASRSQMAEAFAHKYLPRNIKIVSAGTKPASTISSDTIKAMAEVGIDMSKQKPKLLTIEMVNDATHFISMGCGVMESCPFPIAKDKIEIEDWDLEDTKGKDIAAIRKIRDLIEQKIKDLAKKLTIK